MTVITRITRLFRADFHVVLDRLEEPDVLLRQALREMEAELATDQQREKRCRLDLEHLQNKRTELENLLESIAEELNICFSANRESLARNVIKRKLETERLSECMDRQIAALAKSLNDLRSRLQDRRERLTLLQQKVASFDDNPSAVNPSAENRSSPAPVSENEIEIAFLREKQRRMLS